MTAQPKPNLVTDNVVVSLEYTLKVNGEVFEISPEGDPIQFIQGLGQIIPGLEQQLYGMHIGEQKIIEVPSELGYGDIDPDAFMEVTKEDFPEDIPLALGTQLEVQDEDGEELDATIYEITDDRIKLDFNHPLAGKDLVFEIRVADLRLATDEEIEHGHLHGEDDECEECED